MPDLHSDQDEQEYEPPAIVSLGSVDEVTAGIPDDNSITTTTVESDARLKTDVAVVTSAVGRLRQL